MAGRENGESGALSPLETAQGTYKTGLHHLNEPSQLAFVKMSMEVLCSLLAACSRLQLLSELRFCKNRILGFQECSRGYFSNWTSYHPFRRSRAIYIAPILVLHSAL